MKYVSIIILCIGILNSTFGQVDAISKYFDQYVEDDRFTMVYISPKMFELITKLDLDEMKDEEAAMVLDIVSDLKGLRVLTTEFTPIEFYKEAVNKINMDEYELLLSVRDKGDNVRFVIKDDGNIINELLLLVGGSDEFVMVSFVGKIDLNKISELSKVIDIDGAEHLEKIGKKKKKDQDDNDQ